MQPCEPAQPDAAGHVRRCVGHCAAFPGELAGVEVQGVGAETEVESSRICGSIRPNVAFGVAPNMKAGQYKAGYEMHVLDDGRQAGAPRLLKASGLPAFDQAVERAIRACNPFPNQPTGNPPRTIQLTFDPVDSKR